MIDVIKKHGKTVRAYRLGKKHPVLEKLMEEKKIVPIDDGEYYEVFSQESINAESGHGQIACVGDYVKIDSKGFPYPNEAAFFYANHRHIGGDEYEQTPKPLKAWTVDEPICQEVEFLICEKGLVLNESDPEKYFYAILWGNPEAAKRDAVLVFYSLTYGENGVVQDADFNFVERSEFDKTYDILN